MENRDKIFPQTDGLEESIYDGMKSRVELGILKVNPAVERYQVPRHGPDIDIG